MRRLAKHVMAFLLFFGLFYVESSNLGPVSIAVIWKVVLLGGFLFYLLTLPGRLRVDPVLLWGGLFAVHSLVNPSLFSDPIETISFAIKNAFIPISFEVFHRYFSRKADPEGACYRALVVLSVYIVFSSVPFHLKLIQPLQAGYDLSIFQMQGSAFLGLFQNAHASALTFATATLVLFYHLGRVEGRTRLFCFALVLLGSTSTALTLARTGTAMLIFGIAALSFFSRNRIHRITGLAMLVGGTAAGFVLYQVSELFRMRLLGENYYTLATGGAGGVSSGRDRFWQAAIDNFLRQDLTGHFLGMGPAVAKDEMEGAVGLHIYAHNGFIDILQFNGYIGVTLYVIFMFYVLRLALRLWRNRIWASLLAVMIASYLMQMLVQGERIFLADIILALSLAAARIVLARERKNHTPAFEPTQGWART